MKKIALLVIIAGLTSTSAIADFSQSDRAFLNRMSADQQLADQRRDRLRERRSEQRSRREDTQGATSSNNYFEMGRALGQAFSR